MKVVAKSEVFQLDSEFRRILIGELFSEFFNLEKSEKEDLSINSIFKCIKFKIVEEERIKLFIKLIIDGYNKRVNEIAKSLPMLSKVNNMKLRIYEKHDRFHIVKILVDTHIDFLKNLIKKYVEDVNSDMLYITGSKISLAISKKEVSIKIETKRNRYFIKTFKDDFYKFKVIKDNKQNNSSIILLIEKDLNTIYYAFEHIFEVSDSFIKHSSHESLRVKLKRNNGSFIKATYNEELDITEVAKTFFRNYDINNFIDKLNEDEDNFIENLITDTVINKDRMRNFLKKLERVNMKIIEFVKSGGAYLID